MKTEEAIGALEMIRERSHHKGSHSYEALTHAIQVMRDYLAASTPFESPEGDSGASSAELFMALGASADEAERQERELNAILRRGSM